MYKPILSKLTQGILITTLVFAGSFAFVEESAEKTEKTEKEAIHRSYQSNARVRSIAKQLRKQNHFRIADSEKEFPFLNQKVISDFNVNYIYTTSYLDSI